MKSFPEHLNELLSALIGLGRAAEGNENRPDGLTHQVLLNGIQLLNADLVTSEILLKQQISLLHKEKYKLISRCLNCKKQCGRNDDYSFFSEENTDAALFSLKYVLLSLIQTVGEHVMQLPALSAIYQSSVSFLYDSLFFLGKDVASQEINARIMLACSVLEQIVYDDTSFLRYIQAMVKS